MEKHDDRPSEKEDSKKPRPVSQLLDWLRSLPPGGKLSIREMPRKQKEEREEGK
jgi:hypothetical protein